MGKYIYNIEDNQERFNKTNKNKIHFIKSLSNNINNNSQSLSYLSQAYVFYKLSKNQVINLDKLRSVLQYHGTSLFLKKKIKNYFGAQGILHSELKYKKLHNSGMNQWKNWLRGHYQYNLSKIRWSQLVPQKWENRVNQSWLAKNKDLNKWDSYEKDQVIDYRKENQYTLPNQKVHFKKHYRYDLLSSKSINLEDKENSYIYISPLQVNKISYNYNTHKHKLFDGMGGILIKYYLGKVGKDGIMDMEKNLDRKYFDWKIIHFCRRMKVDMSTWIDTNSTKSTKTSNDQKMDKKGLFYLMIPQEINPSNQTNKKKRFDWMGMNEEILNLPILNLELWFFPELALLYDSYKIKPWVIPIKLLLFNFNGNKNSSANKKNKIKDSFILLKLLNKKKYLELENRKKKEYPTQRNLGSDAQNQKNHKSVLSNQEKNINVEEYYASGSDIKKRRNKKQYKSNTEAELDFFLKKYLIFQLRCDDSLNQRMINNIKVYCLLLRLINPREIAISSIQRGEMSLDIMLIQKDLTLTELMKKGIFIIEPVRLSVKNDGKFIMYQTISISLIHKSKDQPHQRYQEKIYVDKNNFEKSISSARHQKITRNRDKKNYVLLVPENILSPRRRREVRILICFTSRNRNGWDRNPVFCDGKNIKNCGKFLDKSKNLDIDKNKLIKLKLLLLLTYQLEDLACMHRYRFDTTNGSRFSMVRIHMYPQ